MNLLQILRLIQLVLPTGITFVEGTIKIRDKSGTITEHQLYDETDAKLLDAEERWKRIIEE